MKQDNWKQRYRLHHQAKIALGLLALSILAFALFLRHGWIAAAWLGGFPAIFGSVFYFFSDKWGFLRWTILFMLASFGIHGFLQLEGFWFSVAVLVIGVTAVIWSTVSEFIDYYHSHRYSTYFCKTRRGILSWLCYPVRRDSVPAHFAESDADCILAQTAQGKPVQIIPGKQGLYVHYLETSPDGREILPESRLTEYRYIDSMKKPRHDYRMHYTSMQNAECWCMRFPESPCEGAFTVTGILKIQQKRYAKLFYLCDDSSEEKLRRLLSPLKKLKFHRERPTESMGAWELFRKTDKQRKAWLAIRTFSWLAVVLSISGIAPDFEMQRIFMTSAIGSVLAAILFFCIFSGTFTIRDYHRHDNTGLYSRTPNISGTLFMTSCILALLGMVTDIVDFGLYALISLCVGAVLAGILIFFAAPDDREKTILPAFMIGIFFSFGAVGSINYLYDPHEPDVHSSLVYDMHTSHSSKGGTSYYVEIAMSDGKRNDISVSSDFYRETEIGDMVSVYEYKGLFEIAYVKIHK